MKCCRLLIDLLKANVRSSRKKNSLVVVAGQVPPPIGGQNVMIAELLQTLSSFTDLRVRHLPFFFTESFSTVRRFRFGKILNLVAVYFRLFGIFLKDGRPDILLYPSGGPQTIPVIRDILLLPWMTLLSRKVIVQFHAAGIGDRLSAQHGILEWLLQFVYKPVHHALVMTEYNRRDPEALGLSRITIIPHKLVDRNPESRLPQFDAPIRLLYAGHLYDQKGTPQLVEAFGKIAFQFPDTRLVLMGEFLPPYSEEICRRRLSELKISERVELTGVQRGLDKEIKFMEATAFIFPSIAPYESFGLVLAEAMMWGLPIVITDWRGNADVTGRPPQGILVSTEGDLVENLAEGLSQLLNQKFEWMKWGMGNRQRFLEKFCRGIEIDPYFRVIEDELEC